MFVYLNNYSPVAFADEFETDNKGGRTSITQMCFFFCALFLEIVDERIVWCFRIAFESLMYGSLISAVDPVASLAILVCVFVSSLSFFVSQLRLCFSLLSRLKFSMSTTQL